MKINDKGGVALKPSPPCVRIWKSERYVIRVERGERISL